MQGTYGTPTVSISKFVVQGEGAFANPFTGFVFVVDFVLAISHSFIFSWLFCAHFL
jgi:hypothetical protein